MVQQRIEPEKDRLQHLSYAELDHFESFTGIGSVFYCRDIHTLSPKQAFLEAQGIRSTCSARFVREKGLHGFVGFDECTVSGCGPKKRWKPSL